MTRLKYNKTASGTLVSDVLVANTKVVQVWILPSVLEYKILEKKPTKDVTLLHSTRHKTLRTLKKDVRTNLVKLGVDFLDEIRNTGKRKKLKIRKTK